MFQVLDEQIQYNPILDAEIYIQLEKIILNDQDNSNFNDFQTDVAHVHNKMLFDSLNEILDTKRSFGIQGEVYPNRLLWRPHTIIKEQSLATILHSSINKLMEWNSYMCGFIHDKDDSFGQIICNLEEEIINQIKEDRLFKLVQAEVADFDEKIFSVEEELFEIVYFVSEVIFEDLVSDLVTELQIFKITK